MNYPIEKLNVYTLNVGYAQHDGDWNWKNVRSPFARLYLVVEGSAQIAMHSTTYSLTPGHLYLIPAFTTHSCICHSLFSHYYIHIYEDSEAEKSIMGEWDFPVEVEATDYDVDLMKRLAFINPFLKLPMSNPDAYDNHSTLLNNIERNLRRPFCDKVESRGIIFILLSRFIKLAVPKAEIADGRIRAVVSHIRQSLSSSLNVETLADMACMSKDHFIRTFKKEVGTTPSAFVTKKRMEAAELLLITTNETIKTISAKVGYDDNSYFNKTFKRYAGVTPQQYRGVLRGER